MRDIRQILNRRRRYDDLSASIQEHLDEKIEELIESGMSPAQAERAARRAFGNVTLIEQHSREVWQWATFESIGADLTYAIRQLRRSPGFTVTAVLTLALGIAVNATMFSMVSAFLMPHLPGHDSERLVVVSSVNPDRSFLPDTEPVSAPNYVAWRANQHLFADMAAANDDRIASMAAQGEGAEAIHYASVSLNYFSLFGVSPQVGRSFVAGEDQPGHDHVLILSHGLWERRFASDPTIVGRAVRLNREDYVVVGVMGADFRLLGFTPQLWTPLTLTAADLTAEARKDRSLFLFARLVPGITLAQARAEMNALAQRAQAYFPAIERRWGAAVRALPDYLVYNFGIRTGLAVMMTTVSFVLLIACANVAGLLLTRATARQKELAIRVSLGARRARIVRQLLTEGLVIALLGGGIGLFLAQFGIRYLHANLSFNDAITAVPLRLDRNVLLFALGVSLLSAVLSSLAPALRASRIEVNADLKIEGRTASPGRSHGRLRTVLVGGEIALALFLLIGTSLLIRGILLLEHQKLGFRYEHLLTAGVVLDPARYNDAAQQIQFARDLTARLEQLPAVENVAIASDLPASGPGSVAIHIKGEPESPATGNRSALDVVATSQYFPVTGIPLLRGRTFTDADDANTPRVVLVNQEFVHRYLPNRDPRGQQIQLDFKGAPSGWSTIVGVVSDVKSFSEETRVDPQVYEPFLQRPVASFSLLLRSSVEPDSLAPALRRAVAEQDSELPLLRVMSMDNVIENQRYGDPLFTHLLASFAMLALILASIGIYGLVAFTVSQRTHEIGIRIALGAKAADISRMILREGFKVAAIGSAIGLVLALPLPKLFDSLFQGIHFAAPELYPVVLAVILVVVIFATYGPARRATRVNPTTALRNE